tara:strand:+ start:283 stop:639 length:357 start_codon:yes stop_codon:yes gene_type:complete
MKSSIISSIKQLNKSLINIKLPIINNIIEYQNEIITNNDIVNIKQYINKLANDRMKIKKLIQKFERSIMEIDKLTVNKKINKELIKTREQNSDILYDLHHANDQIKITLKNIINTILY